MPGRRRLPSRPERVTDGAGEPAERHAAGRQGARSVAIQGGAHAGRIHGRRQFPRRDLVRLPTAGGRPRPAGTPPADRRVRGGHRDSARRRADAEPRDRPERPRGVAPPGSRTRPHDDPHGRARRCRRLVGGRPPHRATSTIVALLPTELLLIDGAALRGELSADAELAAPVYLSLLEALARRLTGTRLQLLDLFTIPGSEPW